jgi:integrase
LIAANRFWPVRSGTIVRSHSKVRRSAPFFEHLDRFARHVLQPDEAKLAKRNDRGFGLRISPQGRKTYLAQYRVKGAVSKQGKPLEVSETFGTADKVTLAEAQRQARASFALAREGIHPVMQRKQKFAAAQASVEERAFTFEKLAERYLAEYVYRNNRPSTAKEARRLLTRAMRMPCGKGTFGNLPASAITREHIVALLAAARAGRPEDQFGETNGRVEANSLLGALQRCFRWGREALLVDSNPALDIAKPMKSVPSRERYLDDDEIVAFWHGCDQVGWPFGAVFKLLLLTGQRLNEVGGMRWSKLNIDKRTWVIPAARAKNNKTHEVALSGLAMEILQGLPLSMMSSYSRHHDRVSSASPSLAFIMPKQSYSRSWVRQTGVSTICAAPAPPAFANLAYRRMSRIKCSITQPA